MPEIFPPNKHTPNCTIRETINQEESYVYVITSGKSTKIGITSSPYSRLLQHKTSNPNLTNGYSGLYKIIADNKQLSKAREIEQHILKTFSSKSIYGEWFSGGLNTEKKIKSILRENPSTIPGRLVNNKFVPW